MLPLTYKWDKEKKNKTSGLISICPLIFIGVMSKQPMYLTSSLPVSPHPTDCPLLQGFQGSVVSPTIRTSRASRPCFTSHCHRAHGYRKKKKNTAMLHNFNLTSYTKCSNQCDTLFLYRNKNIWKKIFNYACKSRVLCVQSTIKHCCIPTQWLSTSGHPPLHHTVIKVATHFCSWNIL